ncbi:MAG: CvpA family protein [Ruminococcaceae bacterium]|nr:CvpA family protein [Oscillospiraceae bacterium]
MSIVLDIVLVLLVIVIVILAAKRGILVTIAEVVAFAVAIFLAAQTAEPIAKVMYTGFFHKTVERKLYENLPANSAALTTADKAKYVIDNMPEFVKKQAEKVGIDVAAVSNQIAKTKLDTSELYKSLESEIVQPIAVAVLKHILYFFLAVIYGIILRIICVAIAKSFKQSESISSADRTIGAIIGIVEGLVVVFLISNLLVYIQPRIENGDMQKAISDSAIVQICDKFDPMEAISMAEAFAEK